MTVSLHGESAPVLVTEPTRHCRNIDARFNAARRKQMSQIMVRDSLHADDAGRPVHRLLAFEHFHNRSFRVGIQAFRPESLKQSSHLRNHRHFSELAVFGPRLGVAPDRDLAAREINVGPCYIPSLADSKAAKSQESHEICAGPGKAAAG